MNLKTGCIYGQGADLCTWHTKDRTHWGPYVKTEETETQYSYDNTILRIVQ